MIKARPGFVQAIGGVVLMLSLATAACTRDERQIRYRMLVQVETPEGVRRGASVIGLIRRTYPSIQSPDGIGRRIVVRGEAVPVDLPNGRTLYMLLARLGFIEHVLAMLGRSGATADAFTRIAPSDYPLFVTFRDPRNPATVTAVDPAALEATFGEGYRLTSVAVRLTNAPVSNSLSGRLPWVVDLPDTLAGAAPGSVPELADNLTTMAFRRMDK